MIINKRLVLLLQIACLCAITGAQAKQPAQHSATTPPHYIGSNTCRTCHEQQYQHWQGSDHDLAMQVANDKTVLGDFNHVAVTHHGITSRFFKRDNAFFVNTPGPDGKARDYKIAYTFGVKPLQQYLIAFPDGRYQALSIAWDSRTQAEGGQRWYHLSPDAVAHTDSLHWSKTYYNWNSRCAQCHSTDLKKNYSLQNDSYDTTWFEINVGCEACHGPGSAHQQWANSHTIDAAVLYKGFTKSLADTLYWPLRDGQKVARPEPGAMHSTAAPSRQLETCAPCHSRRSTISTEDEINRSGQRASDDAFLNHYQLQTLQEGLYHADGQMLDEVYVYGSFIQSKMYQQGVKCSNCHNPHSLQLKAKGNALCAQCHRPDIYDTQTHHHHKTDSSGAQCVNCHMPATTYMGVDDRRDHSLRIPRPDLSEKLQTPNACNQCHQDQSANWATNAIATWQPGNKEKTKPYHYAWALHAGRQHADNALTLLSHLANNKTQPAIARATALQLLQRHPTQQAYQTAITQLQDNSALVRIGALHALEFLPPGQRWQTLSFMLQDNIKSVRLEAARILSVVPNSLLTPSQQATLKKALDEYIRSQLVNADMPNAHLNLGIVYANRGDTTKAEQAYRRALKSDANHIGAMMNLADLYRSRAQHNKALQLLIKASQIAPEQAPVLHALGLAFVRIQQTNKALPYLQQAASLAPQIAHYGYTYALALDAQGKRQQALTQLQKTLQRHPHNRDLLYALATINRDLGNIKKALQYANKLVNQFPDDRAAAGLQQQLYKLAQ